MMLDGFRVVELEGSFGAACTRFLASLGAVVIKVADTPDGVGRLPELCETADALVESVGAGLSARGFSYDVLAARSPRLIHASITAFGSYGPYANYRGSELVASAMGGVLRTVGYPDRPPVKEALDACVFHACGAAAAAIMLAHYERGASGRGQHVDVSVHEVAASRNTNGVLLWQFDRRKVERSGYALRYGRATVRCIWPLADGYAFHSLMSGRFGAPANEALSRWMDDCGCDDNPLRDVDFGTYDRSTLPAETRAVWEEAIERFFRARTKAEISGEGRRRGINATVVQEPADVIADPHLAARGFWSEVQVSGGEPVRLPRYFVQAEESEGGGSSVERALTAVHADAPPLAGVKVLDLSWALVGSISTKGLADHGAHVIKVESASRPCLTRTDLQVAVSTRESFDDKPWFAHLNTSKQSLRLNLKHPRAREVLEPLIEWADVVVENFSPGTLKKLGLDYEALRKRRPDLIMVSGSTYGQTGPLSQEWGVDGTGAALSGRIALTGWPDRPPVTPGAVPFGDVVLPQFMVAATAAALADRRRTGRGRHIDAAMYEVGVQQMAGALEAAQLGRAPRRMGNRSDDVLVQGVYRTRGGDRFIAISVLSESDWSRLTAFMGGSWPDAAALRAADDGELDALDRRIEAFAVEHEDGALMRALQARGIAAGVVQDAEDLLERDPQLRARPAFKALEHPALGHFDHQTSPYHFSRTRAQISTAPMLGEHTEIACTEVLQIGRDAFEELKVAGVFY